MTSTATEPRGPAVAAIGGGHGLAAALLGIREYTSRVTAIVNVADDGGSSGRLRREYSIPPPGDLRRALGALAPPSPWRDAFEHRFERGDLTGHPLGNLVLLGLTEALGGDFSAALDEAGRTLGIVGRVVPATTAAVELRARVGTDDDGDVVEGQVAVTEAPARIRRIELVPAEPPACEEALDAIAAADQIVLAPGSLFSSVLPVLAVPAIGKAVTTTTATVVQVLNLAPQIPETEGFDGDDHVRAVVDHGGRVDRVVCDPGGVLTVDDEAVGAVGATVVRARVARSHGLAHDPRLLGKALQALR